MTEISAPTDQIAIVHQRQFDWGTCLVSAGAAEQIGLMPVRSQDATAGTNPDSFHPPITVRFMTREESGDAGWDSVSVEPYPFDKDGWSVDVTLGGQIAAGGVWKHKQWIDARKDAFKKRLGPALDMPLSNLMAETVEQRAGGWESNANKVEILFWIGGAVTATTVSALEGRASGGLFGGILAMLGAVTAIRRLEGKAQREMTSEGIKRAYTLEGPGLAARMAKDLSGALVFAPSFQYSEPLAPQRKPSEPWE